MDKILPKTLNEIKGVRLREKALEKIAPTTGYPDLDRLIKGFIPGHLYTFTGDTNVGKSSAAANFAVKVASQKRRVLYVSLEPDNTIIDYIASAYHNKPFSSLVEEDYNIDLKIDVFNKEHVPSLNRLVYLVGELPRYDLIIVDHIGYFITDARNYLQEQSNAIKKLVSLAKKFNTAVMIIAHLRKRAKGEKKAYVPSSDDISGSGAFKQDSTEVLILTRKLASDDPDEIQYSNEGALFVTKTKVGPNGKVPILFSDKSAKISTPEEPIEGTTSNVVTDATIEWLFGSKST